MTAVPPNLISAEGAAGTVPEYHNADGLPLALKGTHAYDIICSFGNRVERVYRGR